MKAKGGVLAGVSVVLAACAAAAPPAPPLPSALSAPASSVPAIFEVSTSGDPARRFLRWREEAVRTGELFAVVGQRGQHALVRTRRVVENDCDHCVGPLVEVELVSGQLDPTKRSVAIGPVAGAMPAARIEAVPLPGLGDTWQPSLRVDLDGDGTWDYEETFRCGRWVPSGCHDRACSAQCVGVRRAGGGAVERTTCVGFVPDVDDCQR